MGEVAVEGIVGMGVGTRDGFTPEQPRSVLTTTPSSLAGWAITSRGWPVAAMAAAPAKAAPLNSERRDSILKAFPLAL